MTRNFLLAVFTIFTISLLYAQQNAIYTQDAPPFSKAVVLYRQGQYLAAQRLFAKIRLETINQNMQGDCTYYIADCAIRLNQQDADRLMESFVNEYPTSLKKNDAYLDMADYYFDNGRYPFALKWYEKIDEANLNSSKKDRFYFNRGYTLFRSDRLEEAKAFFSRLENSPTYGNQAKYYLGYLAYQKGDYQQATELFEGVGQSERFKESLSYYRADMNFKLGNFEEALRLGLEQYDKVSPGDRNQLAKIIGESYFNLGEYTKAVPYLESYHGMAGKWTNTDYYQLGYAFYKQGDFERAAEEFSKIIDGQDAVAQNAYYHLADSYLKQGKQQQALNAFKNASEMRFSEAIREDAFLNYAKLSYAIGNSYQSVPEVLNSFIEAYPDNPAGDELKRLIIDSYLTSRNYREALRQLEGDRSADTGGLYQKVTFFRGLELYNEGQLEEAADLFGQSLSEPDDPYYTARAAFWKAEMAYLRSKLEESLEGYLIFLDLEHAPRTPEFEGLPYHLGYNYFKLKNYPQAIAAFSKVLNSEIGVERKKDTHLRLGDSHFVSSDYWAAIEQYNKAMSVNSAENDYAAYQKALACGFVDRTAQKTAILESFGTDHPLSFYRDDALYELGNTLLYQEKDEKALVTYRELETVFPQSSYIPRALLKTALVYYNRGQEQMALDVFKRVAARYPATDEALQAVSSARLIYIDRGEVSAYAQWVTTLDFVELTDAELDNDAWKAAEQPYLEKRKKFAASRLEQYLQDFPSGTHAMKAHFYLAQILYENDPALALEHYLYVADKEHNEYSEQALVRAAETYLAEKEYGKALPLLERLEKVANFKQNMIFAQSNSMRSAYELEQYEKAVHFAEKVLRDSRVDPAVRSGAHLIVARSALQMGDEKKARDAYEALSESATGKLAAEALYYRARFLAGDRNFEGSNGLIQKMAREYPGFKEFGAKGLILMAQNFYALGDAFQATYILESVVKNFTAYPDIVAEARVELESVRAKEAQTNASVETDGN